MSSIPLSNDLPVNFYVLKEPGFSEPGDPNRPNRLCICFSDVHFTDGTVGVQSADDVVWEEVFDNIMDMCVDFQVEELTLLLAGDVADMIRTKRWAEVGVYPWEREKSEFKTILRDIMREIVRIHTQPPSPSGKTGFFYLLKQLPKALEQYEYRNGDRNEHKKSRVRQIRTLALVGNHDKEILSDDDTLKMFYEDCLGQPVETLSDEYRRWVGKMYFDDENHYLDDGRKSVPWLPFYWGDEGFRLFVTHGQWRDPDNSRSIEAREGTDGWNVEDGWRPDVWQKLEYRPFTEPCFGDTVAAGLLSGFIYRAKEKLPPLEKVLRDSGKLGSENGEAENAIRRLKRVLDELDLYRPTAAAVQRIILETRLLRKIDHHLSSVRTMIEGELVDSIHAWLDWKFTMESAPPSARWILRIAKPIIAAMAVFGAPIELWFLYWIMSLLAWRQRWHRDEPSYDEMLKFPAFLEEYRKRGFRIHGEGHTHIPLQEELYFDTPKDRQNYTYINFGAWRDQLVPKEKQGYRRRGIGRALAVLDKAGKGEGQPPLFAYWVQDVLSWGDKADRLDL